MPLLNSIATPYAEALLQVAESRKETDIVAEQAKGLLAVWNSSPELRQALASPVLEPESKKMALAKLFDDQLTPSFQNLLKLLADRQRISVLDAVLRRFLELYRDLRNITLAKVTSATELSEEQKEQLNKKVQLIAGTKAVEFDLVVDPSLIGGFIVSMGSQVIDASLSGQVRRLGLALAKVS
ncbi:F0F1 ATP synthase subunit delta [Cyanobium sp. HWJ4-Hawea]|uniref:ATP synthase F1 subunit delta n=1 Tax=unclassified Cyanobium TaxID=2627006 RepID=UPI0020CB78A4|nr:MULTISPECIES: ATP synthase F1 subunit delta [unclassified Cyanobium]MCP9775223.1 F0F1 ATP synthase subunit delta [Cyanobium sp. WAJ14-Wanaka]MCP9809062.1 F0F1 ATP synthase subunit delta [Cyanobium sp. HWJ4-Hawea]